MARDYFVAFGNPADDPPFEALPPSLSVFVLRLTVTLPKSYMIGVESLQSPGGTNRMSEVLARVESQHWS